MDERVRAAGRRRRLVLIAGMVVLLLLGGAAVVAVKGRNGGSAAAGPDASPRAGRSTAALGEPTAAPTSSPTLPRSGTPSPGTPGGFLSPSTSGQAPGGPAGTSGPHLTAEREGSFRVTAIKVHLTATSYQVTLPTSGGPPWIPFTLTVTAGPGLAAAGATGRPTVISGAPPHSYGGAITSHTTCLDWTITATVIPGPAAPGGLTDTGILQQAC